ncbi:MAG: zf-HC2 domain-containing protein [Phycisphaerae bacterium]
MDVSLTCRDFDSSLTALVAGRLDALSADQIDALQAHLDDCESCALRLSQAPVAAKGDSVAAALAAEVVPPTAAQWEQTWSQIESRTAGARGAEARSVPTGRREPAGAPMLRRVLRWTPIAAAAAFVLVYIGVSRLSHPDPGWTPTPGGIADVQDLEVFDDSTPMVLSAGGDNGVPVIWVIQDGGSS